MAKKFTRGRVLSSQCPSRQLLNHLTSKWGVLVLIVLRTGTKRFSEIKQQIEGINERMLAKTLQELEADGMIHRKSYDCVPPKVEYRLSHYGTQAAEKLADLVGWLEENLSDILRIKDSEF